MELTIDQALQKAVEAHKAGQAQEADRLYTAILKAQPKHPDANHNMGVLAVGVGKTQEALPFLKTALEANPEVAQFWLSYIDTLIKLDRMIDAKAVFDQAKSKGAQGEAFDQLKKRLISSPPAISNTQKPSQEQLNSLFNLYDQNKLQQVFAQAQKLTKRYTKSLTLWNLLGVSAAQLGQLDDSVTAFQKAINIKPDNAEAYNNMGVTLKEQGKLEEAIEAYKKALTIKPDYGEAHYNMGNALKERGKLEEAIETYNKALAIQPDNAEAYNNMGNALKEQGKLEEAIETYNKALAIQPDNSGAQHLVNSLTGKITSSAPRKYVEGLFDGYAHKFEQSLVGNLEYKTPKLIADIIVKDRGSGSLGAVLDLGCGTGLLGVEIKDYCRNLEGIDLSKKMLGLADAKRVYDRLIHADILDFLADTDLCFDYFIATDVLVYVGDLTELFRLIKSRNKRKGKLVFSTEHTELDGFQLEKTGRYSHSKTYIEELCAKFKYTISHFSMRDLRKEKGQFLTGGLYILDF